MRDKKVRHCVFSMLHMCVICIIVLPMDIGEVVILIYSGL